MTVIEKREAFKEIALGRRSVRCYDETVEISREEMTEMLGLAVSAPSSSNMLPWRFVIMNREQVGMLLGMDCGRYEPVMLLAIGKAAETGHPPYRLPVTSVAKFYE